MGRFIIKHLNNKKPQVKRSNNVVASECDNINNIVLKNEEVMTTSEKVEMVKELLKDDEKVKKPAMKRLKKDKGLIERTESSKIVLTEDNKELLKD